MDLNLRKISMQQLIAIFFLAMIFFLQSEIFYLSEYDSTGSGNMYIIKRLLPIAGIIFFLNTRFTKDKYLEMIAIFIGLCYIYLYGKNFQTQVYMISILILYLIKDIKFPFVGYFFGSTIIWGFVLSAVQYVQGIDRVTGFLNTSPTLFSYLITLAASYVFFKIKNKYIVLPLIILSVIQIYWTGSRSTYIIIVMLIVYYILSQFYKNNNLKMKIYWTTLIIVIIMVLLSLYNFDYFHISFELRSNGQYSNQTRSYLINYFLNDLLHNPVTLLIGNKGGYTANIVPVLLGLDLTYYPLHQDILMWTVEYGLFGWILLGLVIYVLNKNWKLPLSIKVITMILFILGTFHNIFVSPISLVILKLLYNSVGKYNERREGM